jgi:transcriptional regulator with XRE-family HTH domain
LGTEAIDPLLAHRFRQRLRADLAARKLTQKELGTAIGIHQRSVSCYTTGSSFPSMSVAIRMSEALVDPDLMRIVREARTQTCRLASCGRPFILDGVATGARIFCTNECQRASKKGGKTARTYIPERKAIDAMCAECQPDGICQNNDCPLRWFSPYPYVGEVDVRVPVGAGRAPMSAEQRELRRRKMQEFYASRTPEEKAWRHRGLGHRWDKKAV